MATADQSTAEDIARGLETRRAQLQRERATLEAAAIRIVEIDAQLPIIEAELARVQSRRPPRGAL